MKKKKIKYQKPQSIDIGKAASVLGLNCSDGAGAEDDCSANGSTAGGNCNGVGANPSIEPYCPMGGVATGNCETNGADAGKTCYATGATAGWGCNTPS